MKKFGVVRFDRYSAVNSSSVVVEASDVKEAYVKGFMEIFADDEPEESDVSVDELELGADGETAGVDYEEESWFIFELITK